MSRELDEMKRKTQDHLEKAKSTLKQSVILEDHLNKVQEEYSRVNETLYWA